MVTERAKPFWIMKSFSSCFLEYRVSAILLRLFSFTAVGFFASKNPEKSAHSEGKYDLRSICLFFCKGHL